MNGNGAGSNLLEQMLAGKAGVSVAAAPAAATAPLMPGNLAALLGTPTAEVAAPALVAQAPAPVVNVAPAAAPAPVVTGAQNSPALAALLAGVAPAVSPAPAPVAAPVAAPTPVAGALAALLSKATPAPVVVAPAPVVVPSAAFQAAAVAAGYPTDFSPSGSIVPPDAPSPTSTPEEVAAANPPKAEAAPEAPAAALDGAQPAKRKRRTKEEMIAARAAEAMVATSAPALPAPTESTMQTVVVDPGAAGIPAASQVFASLLAGAIGQTEPSPVMQAMGEAIVSHIAQRTEEENLQRLQALAEANPATPTIGMLTQVTAGLAESIPVPAADAFGVAKNEAAPEKIDPVMETIKERLRTPDARFACPVKFVFIDCMPGKGWPDDQRPTDLNELMHAFAGNAAANADAADYRLIRYESKGYLAASIRALMRGLPPSVYVDTKTPGADEFLAQVIPYASLVVRATR